VEKKKIEVKPSLEIKYPIEYELKPKSIDQGVHWVILSLKNIATYTITNLDVNLNTLDSFSLKVLGTGKYLADLKPNEVEVIPFKISGTETTRIYVTLKGWMERIGHKLFSWESPWITVKVGRKQAELKTVFAMTAPYPPLGKNIKVDATLEGFEKSEGLSVELWIHTPTGNFKQLAKIETKNLSPGEEAKYSAEFNPEEKGLYTIHAYLYDNSRRIGHEVDNVLV
jgi:hypothetical protein